MSYQYSPARVVVSGSRDWEDQKVVESQLSRVLKTLYLSDRFSFDSPEMVTLVHGGAKGLDSIAGRVAGAWGLTVEVFPADWGRFGRSAGMIRNRAMVDSGATVVVAFPLPQSVGTYGMIRYARSQSVPTIVVDG